MNKQQIKELALSNGFKLKPQSNGEMDLNPYVYEFVGALLAKSNERLNNPQGLQEFICLEQMKDIPLLEIHRAHQKLHEENDRLNERVKELEGFADAFLQLKGEEVVCSYCGKSELCKDFDIFNGGTVDGLLNKFAIKKKIEALDGLLEEIQCSVVVPKRYEQFQEPYLEGIKHCIQFIECQQEQLHKEQE